MYRMIALLVLVAVTACGCGSVQRELTIKTQPTGAVVYLNDEEIGTSPVTVGFNWYGDYRIRASLDGREMLNTHRNLPAPWYDYFPFDFARLLWPAKTTDRYEWTFELQEPNSPTREELIKAATELRQEQMKPAPQQ
jgi:hypothetical protein